MHPTMTSASIITRIPTLEHNQGVVCTAHAQPAPILQAAYTGPSGPVLIPGQGTGGAIVHPPILVPAPTPGIMGEAGVSGDAPTANLYPDLSTLHVTQAQHVRFTTP